MRQIMSIIKKVDDFLTQTARIVTAIAVAIQMVLVFTGVIFRYFLKSPLTWSDELVTYMLVFVTFFGSYVALKDKALAKITILVVKLPRLARRIVVLAANLATVFLLAFVAYYGYLLASSPVILKTVSSAMRMPTVIFYAIIPITAVMMIVHMVVAIYEDLTDTYENEDNQGEEYTCL